MTKKSVLKLALGIFSLILVGNLGVFAQKNDCTKTTEAEIVKAIYDKMAVKYDDQIIHVNVRVKDGAVTLEGWATTDKISKAIEKIARKTGCVKSVSNELTIAKGGGCGPGTKKCGAICIPDTETCNICTAKTCN